MERVHGGTENGNSEPLISDLSSDAGPHPLCSLYESWTGRVSNRPHHPGRPCQLPLLCRKFLDARVVSM